MAEVVEQTIGATDNTVFVMSTGDRRAVAYGETARRGCAGCGCNLRPRAGPPLHMRGTTDTLPKLETRSVVLGVAGDGSERAPLHYRHGQGRRGIIHPNMATMLAVVATRSYVRVAANGA